MLRGSLYLFSRESTFEKKYWKKNKHKKVLFCILATKNWEPAMEDTDSKQP